MTLPALRWAAMRAILTFQYWKWWTKSQDSVHKPQLFWKERRAEAVSNRGSSAYQPNALPLGQTGSHSRRMAAIRFYLLSRRQFSTPPKSSRARTDKRTARATGNTRYRYSKNGPLDHKMADNCVSLARTNTLSSTITKPVKTWKTSNKSYSYNLLNRINKMYTRDLFYLQQ